MTKERYDRHVFDWISARQVPGYECRYVVAFAGVAVVPKGAACN